jgi:hypothetical protein
MELVTVDVDVIVSVLVSAVREAKITQLTMSRPRTTAATAVTPSDLIGLQRRLKQVQPFILAFHPDSSNLRPCLVLKCHVGAHEVAPASSEKE